MPVSAGYVKKWRGLPVGSSSRVGLGAYNSGILQRLSERDILWLQRLSNGERIKYLNGVMREASVKNHMLKVREFLGVKTTVQAVAEAIRRGIIK